MPAAAGTLRKPTASAQLRLNRPGQSLGMDIRNRFSVQARDAAQRRLRRLTTGSAVLSAGAVAVFASVSWATLPGASSAPTATASTPATSDTPAATSDTTTSSSAPVQPAPAPTVASSGPSHAVTGGSR